ncbi:unnamed protein product [Mytilus edulis]|uniref:DZIP3-like HEPN domain-containing protein n=1 Tax=Mytilus edulis TaxID=6550 RepID=A0A8S3RU52_MYTED|nr:unnamed protein product [Mytilus edulis]
MDLLFDRSSSKLRCHNTARTSDDFCCSKAKVGLCTDVLDLTLARCLLVNFCSDVFWFSCLQFQSITLEDFLNHNKHGIYHVWQNNTACCQCHPGYTLPTNSSSLNQSDWNQMFSSILLPCSYHTRSSNSICSVMAKPGITPANLNPNVNRIILQYFCKLRKVVEAMVQIRNQNYGHANECLMSDNEYIKSVVKIERLIMYIAKVCNKETQFKQKLQEAMNGFLDQKLFNKYQNLMELQTRQQYIHLLSKEEFNYSRMGRIVLNILAEVLYDLYKLDVPNFERERYGCDITYLYSLHRRCNKHIPSKGWGGSWANFETCNTTIGDDIERTRLTRNELAHSALYELDEIRFNELYDVIFELFKTL